MYEHYELRRAENMTDPVEKQQRPITTIPDCDRHTEPRAAIGTPERDAQQSETMLNHAAQTEIGQGLSLREIEMCNCKNSNGSADDSRTTVVYSEVCKVHSPAKSVSTEVPCDDGCDSDKLTELEHVIDEQMEDKTLNSSSDLVQSIIEKKLLESSESGVITTEPTSDKTDKPMSRHGSLDYIPVRDVGENLVQDDNTDRSEGLPSSISVSETASPERVSEGLNPVNERESELSDRSELYLTPSEATSPKKVLDKTDTIISDEVTTDDPKHVAINIVNDVLTIALETVRLKTDDDTDSGAISGGLNSEGNTPNGREDLEQDIEDIVDHKHKIETIAVDLISDIIDAVVSKSEGINNTVEETTLDKEKYSKIEQDFLPVDNEFIVPNETEHEKEVEKEINIDEENAKNELQRLEAEIPEEEPVEVPSISTISENISLANKKEQEILQEVEKSTDNDREKRRVSLPGSSDITSDMQRGEGVASQGTNTSTSPKRPRSASTSTQVDSNHFGKRFEIVLKLIICIGRKSRHYGTLLELSAVSIAVKDKIKSMLPQNIYRIVKKVFV